MRKDKRHIYRYLNLDYDTFSVLVDKSKYYNLLRKYKNDNYSYWVSNTETNTCIEHYFEFQKRNNNEQIN